jgi:hypothetical protein
MAHSDGQPTAMEIVSVMGAERAVLLENGKQGSGLAQNGQPGLTEMVKMRAVSEGFASFSHKQAG